MPKMEPLKTAVLTAFAIALLGTMMFAIARTYVGHSPGPYGVCYGTSGRSIPCAVAKR